MMCLQEKYHALFKIKMTNIQTSRHNNLINNFLLAHICWQIPDCKYWTWVIDLEIIGCTNCCMLKYASSGYTYLEGAISGPKNCTSSNVKCMVSK